MKNYAVVLFKNKSSKKILKDFVTYKKAKLYFDSLLKENNDVLFSMKIENGKEVFYEIALILLYLSLNFRFYFFLLSHELLREG